GSTHAGEHVLQYTRRTHRMRPRGRLQVHDGNRHRLHRHGRLPDPPRRESGRYVGLRSGSRRLMGGIKTGGNRSLSRDVWDFLKVRKAWWMTPIILILAL